VNDSHKHLRLIVEAITDAVKDVLPKMIEKEVDRRLQAQTPTGSPVTAEQLRSMAERAQARANAMQGRPTLPPRVLAEHERRRAQLARLRASAPVRSR
jgi:hypothetical protein